jgi:hypothetical protein
MDTLYAVCVYKACSSLKMATVCGRNREERWMTCSVRWVGYQIRVYGTVTRKMCDVKRQFVFVNYNTQCTRRHLHHHHHPSKCCQHLWYILKFHVPLLVCISTWDCLSVRLSLHFTNVWFPFLSFSRNPLLISSLISGFLYILRSDGVRKILTSLSWSSNLRTWIWRLVDKLIVAQLVKKVSPRVTELWEVPFPYLLCLCRGGWGVITTHTGWGSVGVTQWLPVSQCGCHGYGRARFVSDVTMHWRQTGRIGRSVIPVFTVSTRCCYLE